MRQLEVELHFGQDGQPPKARCYVPGELIEGKIRVTQSANHVEQLQHGPKPVWHFSNAATPREFYAKDGKRVPATQQGNASKSNQNWYLSPTTVQMLDAIERGLIDDHGRVPVHLFGKDHWSLVGYIGSRISSHPAGDAAGVGMMDPRNLRCNPERHPVHALEQHRGWKSDYGTRLAGFWKDGQAVPEFRLPYHDDWDCLNDLESAGLITVWSEINAFVQFTDIGLHVYGQVMEHKAAGKNFASFRLEEGVS